MGAASGRVHYVYLEKHKIRAAELQNMLPRELQNMLPRTAATGPGVCKTNDRFSYFGRVENILCARYPQETQVQQARRPSRMSILAASPPPGVNYMCDFLERCWDLCGAFVHNSRSEFRHRSRLFHKNDIFVPELPS